MTLSFDTTPRIDFHLMNVMFERAYPRWQMRSQFYDAELKSLGDPSPRQPTDRPLDSRAHAA